MNILFKYIIVKTIFIVTFRIMDELKKYTCASIRDRFETRQPLAKWYKCIDPFVNFVPNKHVTCVHTASNITKITR